MLGAPLVTLLGVNGYGWTNIVVTASNLTIIRYARREVPVHVIGPVLIPWLTAVPVGFALALAEHFHHATNALTLALYAGLAAVAYALLVLATQRDAVRRVLSLARMATPPDGDAR
jgi:hypothetical protein